MPAPPPSGSADIAGQQAVLFSSGALSRKVLDAVPVPLLIINSGWRVVYANRAVLDLAAPEDKDTASGLREGEAFHCVHAREDGGQAGGAESCRVCGIARTVSLSLQGQETVNDCRLNCELGGSAPMELRVWATPLECAGETFSILSLTDLSDQRRRALLENICFHDLLNTLTSIRGFLDVLKHSDVSERPEICELLEHTTRNSIDEIMALRQLATDAAGELPIAWIPLETGTFLARLLKTLRRHPVARRKRLEFASEPAELTIHTDRSLLYRVLGNMVLNALEATDEGGTVTVGCRRAGSEVEFSVQNERFMPREVQLKIFRRPFSTKGGGRGFGTHSIQLLSAYLQGRVGFTSSQETGTTFRATFPIHPQNCPSAPPIA